MALTLKMRCPSIKDVGEELQFAGGCHGSLGTELWHFCDGEVFYGCGESVSASRV
jgi:hypothetical protein